MELLHVLILVFKDATSPGALALVFKYLHVELRAENSNHQLPPNMQLLPADQKGTLGIWLQQSLHVLSLPQ